MTTTQRKPMVGDKFWFVEWCIEQGRTEDGDGDPDSNKYKRRRCASREEAERVSREVFPQSVIGAVSYWPAEFVAYDEDDALRYPHVGFWEVTADEEWYEGEE